MKKLVLLSLTILAVTGLVCGEAFAAVTGTPHDVSIGAKQGVCSSCHIPHKAAGKRLWPSDMGSATTGGVGEVGALCWYCHGTGGQVGTAVTPYPFAAQRTYTHGLLKIDNPDGTDDLDTALPYILGSASGMQCTSCHDVHNNAGEALPFLRDDIDVLCARCHSARQFVGGTESTAEGAWGASYYGDGNPGSHPVGTDVFTDTSGAGNSPITTNQIGTGGVMAYGAATGGVHNLGPHLIDGTGTTWQNGNGMGCVTCHVPHGIDNDGHTAQQNPVADLLANAQNGDPANGLGGASDPLCEACHHGNVPAGYSGSYFPNPGSTTRYTHPVDDYFPSGTVDFGVTATQVATTLGWPTASGSGAPNILCESCHMAHPAAAMDTDNAQQDEPDASTGTHILRDDEDVICDRCHTANSFQSEHHPVGAGLMDGTLFADSNIGDGDSNLTCGDCHRDVGAHNWITATGAGLDTDWEPFDNGRSADSEGSRVVANTSKECIDCHTANGRFSPTRNSAHGQYQNAGDASHWLGQFDASAWALSAPSGSTALSAGTRVFTSEPWNAGGWSRFGGAAITTAIFVCESCHELEPAKNVEPNRLLADYDEGQAESRSNFCEGCHSQNGASGTPHPMSFDTVTKATSVGRTVTTLITSGGAWAPSNLQGTFADAAGAPVTNTTYPATNQMNCDSCHQPHDATSTSGTYILEDNAGATAVTGTPTGSVTAYSTWTNMDYSGGGSCNYTVFCGLCHASGF